MKKPLRVELFSFYPFFFQKKALLLRLHKTKKTYSYGNDQLV